MVGASIHCTTASPILRMLHYDHAVVDPLLLAALFFIAALLYASVGHAGASAYLAVMALASVPPDVARPTALALNILVASFVSYRFWRGGYISWRAVAPFLLGSIPLAFLGGALPVAPGLYKKLVGVVLLFAAAGMALTARRAIATETGRAEPRVPAVRAVGIGGFIGFLSGLTGTGGGIFLSPVVLLAGWAETRAASGLAAVFILGNSIAGLSGNFARLASLPSSLPIFAVAVVVGAAIGSTIGVRRGSTLLLRQALSAVLVVAGLKLLFIG
jgi:uncharacterized membrane protein YfcA